MNLKHNMIAVALTVLLCFSDNSSALAQNTTTDEIPAEFHLWLDDMRGRALNAGISAALVQQAFDGLVPNARILSQDRSQPEFTLDFWEYFERGVSANRIANGQSVYNDIATTINPIAANYRVQPRFLIALWGLESDFGQVRGNNDLVQSLATLAFDPRRRDFFEAELLQLLHIIDQGHMTLAEARGSWAGAFGHTQFMPSTFAAHAVDGDKDGRIHLIDSRMDALASAAHYLRNLGWDDNKTWGREVTLPQGFDYALANFDTVKPLNGWSKLGVTNAWNDPLPVSDVKAGLLLPIGAEGPAFLVYPNFHRIMKWNRSIFFALNVGLLSDAIARLPALQTQKPSRHQRLRYSEIKQYQKHMNNLGYDVGATDGVIGKRTRQQLQKLQKNHQLPADGYLSIPTRQKIDQLTKQN